jgi:poly-gamma-glutamate synthesis protein (capsule biosynthesis protein)
VVVSCHWGLPGIRIAGYQREIGHAAIDAGADIVLGHGPHSLQPVEVYAGKPILYSLGNLVFDWSRMRDRHLDGLVVLADIEQGKLAGLTAHLVRRDEHNNPRRGAR